MMNRDMGGRTDPDWAYIQVVKCSTSNRGGTLERRLVMTTRRFSIEDTKLYFAFYHQLK